MKEKELITDANSPSPQPAASRSSEQQYQDLRAEFNAGFMALPEPKRAELTELLKDMAFVRAGGTHLPDGTIFYVGAGLLLPQTDSVEFWRKLLASPDNWRKIFANEILLV